jgi:hypothetical protein
MGVAQFHDLLPPRFREGAHLGMQSVTEQLVKLMISAKK